MLSYDIGFVYRRMDGQTNGHGETNIPPYNFVAGDINIMSLVWPKTKQILNAAIFLLSPYMSVDEKRNFVKRKYPPITVGFSMMTIIHTHPTLTPFKKSMTQTVFWCSSLICVIIYHICTPVILSLICVIIYYICTPVILTLICVIVYHICTPVILTLICVIIYHICTPVILSLICVIIYHICTPVILSLICIIIYHICTPVILSVNWVW